MRRILFRVLTKEGHEFKIYTDGSTEGFPVGSVIVNCYPMCEAQSIQSFREMIAQADADLKATAGIFENSLGEKLNA